MRLPVKIFAASVLLAAVGCETNWRVSPAAPHQFETADFVVTFPKPPEQESVTFGNEQFSLPGHSVNCTTLDKHGSYSLNYLDFPETASDYFDDGPKVLAKMQSATIANRKATVHREAVVDSGDYASREYAYEYSKGGKTWFCVAREYVVKNRYYRLTLIKTTSMNDVEHEAAEFIQSFRLVP